MARSVTRPFPRTVVTTLALATLLLPLSTVPVLAATASGGATAAGAADVADTIAPTAPANFRVVSRTRSGQITLGWDASYDAVGVAGYSLYVNGTWSGTLYQAGVDLIGTVWFVRLGGRTKGAVTYDLYAFDAAGNVSAPARLVLTP